MGKKNKKHQLRGHSVATPPVVDEEESETTPISSCSVPVTNHQRSFSSPAHSSVAVALSGKGCCTENDGEQAADTLLDSRRWASLFGNGGWHCEGQTYDSEIKTSSASSTTGGAAEPTSSSPYSFSQEEQIAHRRQLKDDSSFLRLQLGKQLQNLAERRQKQQQQEARAQAARHQKFAVADSPKSNTGSEEGSGGGLGFGVSNNDTAAGSSTTGRDRLAMQAKKKIHEDNTTAPSSGSSTSTTTTTTLAGGGSSGKYAVQQYREQAVHWQIKAEQLEESLRSIESRHTAELSIKDDSYREQLETAHQRIEDMRQNSEKEAKRRLEAEENVTMQKAEARELKREHDLLTEQYKLEKERFKEHHQRLVPLQQKLEEFTRKDYEAQRSIETIQNKLQKAVDEKTKLERILRQRESEVGYLKSGKGLSAAAEYHSESEERLGRVLAAREAEVKQLSIETQKLEIQLKMKDEQLVRAQSQIRDQVAAGVNRQRTWQQEKGDLQNQLDEGKTREVKLKEQLSQALSASQQAPPSSPPKPAATSSTAASMAHVNALAELQRECDRLKAEGEMLREELRKRNEENSRLREEMKIRASETAAIQEGFKESVQATTLLVLQDAEDKEAITRERLLEKELGARMALRHYEQTEHGLLGVSVAPGGGEESAKNVAVPEVPEVKQQSNPKKQRKGK